MSVAQSQALFARSQAVIPGGVNSPVRAFAAVGGQPLFITSGEGATITDADGQHYIDYVGSWGPLILGHAPTAVREALEVVVREGTSFGAATWREAELAERVVAAVPSVEKVRFVNSGTEATMSAVRLARGFTGRQKIIKFAGCYHGHADLFLAEAGSGVATLGIPGSDGVPAGAVQDTLIVPWNDPDALAQMVATHRDDLAAIIAEPVPCNMGLVPPAPGFLETLRSTCDAHDALLIFDEVITGFRVGLGGAQELYGVRPDLSTYGKIIGGGLPVGAYGGRRDVMDHIAPTGPVYQAGTLSGNPLAMAAGIATLDALQNPAAYTTLETLGQRLEATLTPELETLGRPARLSRIGSIFHLFFKPQANRAPRDYAEVKGADSEAFRRFFHGMLERGIYLAPSAYEVGFISLAHNEAHIDRTARAIVDVLAASAT